ncbi:interferon-induced protein with tetratricopeptide repeats 2 isoform X6 [Apodemus sylvaticus]|uniref:interferon-induced protein with tetratricopeptide repeats 2 isoform X6 n=1 Tax=Apodemus sylvaticus TaxID=10129 RepID=UPI0022422292|nr:interferon-induced protein with tetratricopeptide repeats 2 isoform X6 [Apodemus sylvaticus]
MGLQHFSRRQRKRLSGECLQPCSEHIDTADSYTAVMSTASKESLESSLRQLKCHFTWNLIAEDESLDEFEDRVFNKDEFQNREFKATMCNILAYVKHRRGLNEEALKCLGEAEDFIQQQHPDRVEIKSLVTWGNYAWVHYHMGQLSKAQAYLDKVKQVCKKFSSPYRIENPLLDCEEGWARLKCTKNQNERVKVCFEKALEKDPKNPEFTSGWAIAKFRLDDWPAENNYMDSLKQAVNLSPDNTYVKVLLALKLAETQENQAKELVEEALKKDPSAIDTLLIAARFFVKITDTDRAIELLRKALEVLQLLNTRETAFNGDRKKLEKLIRKAEETKEMLKHSRSSLYAMIYQNEEDDYYFQKEFKKDLLPGPRQLLHLQYGNFQLFQMNCEDEAIKHYMEGVKIKRETKPKEKMKVKLQRIAQRRLRNDRSDSEALRILAFLRENGEGQQASDKDSEGKVDSANQVPSASLDEAGAWLTAGRKKKSLTKLPFKILNPS